MLTRVEVQWVGFVLPLVSKLPTATFKFNDGEFSVSGRKRELVLHYVKMLNCVFHLLYLIAKFPATIKESALTHIAIHGIQLLIILGIFLTELNFWLFGKEIFRYIEETLKLNQHLGNMFLETREFKSKIRERLFVSIQIGTSFGAAFFTALLLVTKDFPYSSCHLFYNDFGLPFLFSFLVLAVITAFMSLEALGTGIIHVVGFHCICSTNFWLKKSCLEWTSAGSEVPVESNLLVYRSCFILNKTFSTAFGRCFVPGYKLSIGCVAVLCAYGIISLSSQLDVVTVGIFLFLLLTAMCWILPGAILMSSVYDVSKQFKHNLLTRIHNQRNIGRQEIAVQEKQVKACQLVRCQVGNLYHMEAVAKLTLVQKLLDALVFLLVKGKLSRPSV